MSLSRKSLNINNLFLNKMADVQSRSMTRSSQGQHIFKIKQNEQYTKLVKSIHERHVTKHKKDLNIERMVKKFQQQQQSQKKKLEEISNERSMTSYFYSVLKSYFVPETQNQQK